MRGEIEESRPERLRVLEHHSKHIVLCPAELGRERRGEGGGRAAAGDELNSAVYARLRGLAGGGAAEPSRRDPGEHAGAAERGLPCPGVARDEDERVCPEALQDGANLAVTPEEQGAVRGLEGEEAAVRIALRDLGPSARDVQLLQGLAELLAGREALLREALETALQDLGEPRIDVGDGPGDGRDLPAHRVGGDLVRLLAVEGRLSGAQLVEQRPHGIHVGAA